MRKDMKYKLVDTRRLGNGRNSKNMRYRREKFVLEEYEDEEGNLITDISDNNISTRKTGMRDQGWDRKQFGENLNPLARFIRSNVGKRWDKVYSEICEHTDSNGAVSGHIFEHLWDLVIPAHRVFIKDNKPWENTTYDGPQEISYFQRGVWGQFYVHPITGVLKEAPKKEDLWKKQRLQRQEDLSKRLVEIGENTWLSQDIETKLWYLIVLAKQEYREYTYHYSYQREPAYETRTEPVFASQNTSAKIKLPDIKGMYIKVCKSASGKTIRKFIKN